MNNKYMNKGGRLLALGAIIGALLAGCGGGGGGGGAAATVPATVINGVASKGPLNGSTVCAFAITGGAKGAPLGTCATNTVAGNYSIDLGTYTGPVLFEATGGNYVDEATGLTVALASPLRSMLANAVGGATSVAVTPLTELAYQQANAVANGLTTAGIQTAVSNIQTNFGVADIINTMPVDALNIPAGATAAQKTYALALATISQYQNAQPVGTSLVAALQPIQACLAAPTTGCGTGAASVGTALNTAQAAFQAGHPAFTGITMPVASFGAVTAPPVTPVTPVTPPAVTPPVVTPPVVTPPVVTPPAAIPAPGSFASACIPNLTPSISTTPDSVMRGGPSLVPTDSILLGNRTWMNATTQEFVAIHVRRHADPAALDTIDYQASCGSLGIRTPSIFGGCAINVAANDARSCASLGIVVDLVANTVTFTKAKAIVSGAPGTMSGTLSFPVIPRPAWTPPGGTQLLLCMVPAPGLCDTSVPFGVTPTACQVPYVAQWLPTCPAGSSATATSSFGFGGPVVGIGATGVKDFNTFTPVTVVAGSLTNFNLVWIDVVANGVNGPIVSVVNNTALLTAAGTTVDLVTLGVSGMSVAPFAFVECTQGGSDPRYPACSQIGVTLDRAGGLLNLSSVSLYEGINYTAAIPPVYANTINGSFKFIPY